MTAKTEDITRREFLKTGTRIAATVVLTGLSAGCTIDVPKGEKPYGEYSFP